MQTVVVITTGGTIASTSTSTGAKAASVDGAALLQGVRLPEDVEVRVADVVQVNSYDLTFADMDAISRTVRSALRDGDVCGVVVTHGTDTLEETALLLDLLHRDERPVVLTGAQRSHDDPDNDGPSNLADAIAVAASDAARGRGALVCFAGSVYAARGVQKVHTNALHAFADLDAGALGSVDPRGVVELAPPRARPDAGVDVETRIAAVQVAIVSVYPGVDATAIDAHLAAGVDGVVLAATGYGNANAAVVAGVQRCTDAGVPVVVSTRVSAGEVRAVYAGGAALLEAGAVLAGVLRPSQARIQLAVLLAAGGDRASVALNFA